MSKDINRRKVVLQNKSKPIDGLQELFKQIRPGLFYVEYDDFDFDKAAALTNERYRPQGLMCSGIRKGDYAGRNGDVYAGFDTVLVVRVSNKCARYSSIGVIPDYFIPTLPKVLADQKKDSTYSILPQLTCDGINEKGVSIMMFMTPNDEASEDRSNWGGREWGKSAAYTNSSAAQTYNTMLLTRFVLDNAANVDEAVGLVEAVNWFDPDRFTSSGHAGALKWLVADPRKSAVIECIDNEMKILVTEDIDRPSLCTMTANFSSYLFSKGIIQDEGMGYERYELMAELYEKEENTIDGLQRLLKSVSMSEKYRRDISDRLFFATDYMWSESPSGRHFTATELYRGNAKQNPDFHAIVNLEKSRFYDKSLRPEGCKLLVTVYTTVYDLENKSLHLLYKEGTDDDKWHEFGL